jgi:tetratricopeptide (TPR) repeat protein
MSLQPRKTSGSFPTIRYLALIAATAGMAASALAQEQDALSEQPVDIAVLRSARDAFAAAADFSGAHAPAEQIVTTLDATAEGPTVDDLLRLARIQSELREFDEAERNYLRAIEIVRKEGETSAALIGPYQALGRSYINARRFPEAVTALGQARDLSRRDAGLFNVEQSQLIDDLTAANLGLGNTVLARELQLERLDNAVRQFGAGDPRVAPYHDHLGDYLNDSRLRASAREQYAQALSIQEASFGASDARLLGTLRKLVEVDLLLGRDAGARERLAAVLEQNPETDAVERALSLAALGDCASVAEDIPLARQYYVDAFAAAEESSRADADRLFATPEMIDFIPPLSPVDRGTRSRPYLYGSIVLEFDLSAEGRAQNVQSVTAEPAGFMDSDYVRRIRETHFRPRLAAGLPVPATNLRFTHYFRVYAARED